MIYKYMTINPDEPEEVQFYTPDEADNVDIMFNDAMVEGNSILIYNLSGMKNGEPKLWKSVTDGEPEVHK